MARVLRFLEVVGAFGCEVKSRKLAIARLEFFLL